MPQFHRGESVEIVDELGDGSYYSATIVTHLMNQEYIIQYHNLIKEDESGPLREIVSAAKIRPNPPVKAAVDFRRNDAVDAFDNEGWWEGRITGKIGRKKYVVYFGNIDKRVAYGVDQLRVHQDWVNGEWILR